MSNYVDHNNFSPFFMLLQAGDFRRAQKELLLSPEVGNETIKIKGFYDKSRSSKVNGLQLACSRNPPAEFIEVFHEANPKAILEVDSTYQRTALHIAVMNHASAKAVSALIKGNRKAVAMQDMHGRLPIHYAAKDVETGEQTVRYLLAAFPASLRVSDDNGFLPLHVACRMGLPMPIIRLFIRAAPETVLARTNKGSAPFHCASAYTGRDAARQEEIVAMLKHVAVETKKMIRTNGPASIFGGASVSVKSLVTPSRGPKYIIHDEWHENQVPGLISISDDVSSDHSVEDDNWGGSDHNPREAS